ncbi:hypothetical protein PPERSA_04421 [Pseudocohnilembus persalinus]|uniref:Uncharacterized protein n=1 Tax=Pseudocohnilembus persalinus TaxID=266149 RepID=A0A0V0QQM1_PSEPJ|nr:hypothetical protein PPERSA_04421 [Pseudocohnilembus persalinus]|eukprot:KRX04606.1 hypothetical protein PPERSA_04421 [Pseudocohnilembus persalinus]
MKSNTQIDNLDFLSGFQEASNLEELDINLSQNQRVTGGQQITYLKDLDNLETLNMNLAKLENAWDLKPFNKLTDLDNLQDFYLNVKGTDIYGYDAQNLQDKAQKQYPDANIKIEYSN